MADPVCNGAFFVPCPLKMSDFVMSDVVFIFHFQCWNQNSLKNYIWTSDFEKKNEKRICLKLSENKWLKYLNVFLGTVGAAVVVPVWN